MAQSLYVRLCRRCEQRTRRLDWTIIFSSFTSTIPLTCADVQNKVALTQESWQGAMMSSSVIYATPRGKRAVRSMTVSVVDSSTDGWTSWVKHSMERHVPTVASLSSRMVGVNTWNVSDANMSSVGCASEGIPITHTSRPRFAPSKSSSWWVVLWYPSFRSLSSCVTYFRSYHGSSPAPCTMAH